MEESLDQVRLQFCENGLGLLTLSLALVMFGVALHLSPADFRRVWAQPKAAFVGLSAQFLLLPALTVALAWIWQPQPSLALGMLLVACCPGGNMSNFLTLMARGNTALSVSLTAAGSVLALFLTPVNFALWQRVLPGTSALLEDIGMNAGQLVGSLFVMLLVPLGLGLLVAGRFPDASARLRKPFNRLSLLIFFAFLVFAIQSNAGLFWRWAGVLFLLVLVHNALAYLSGFLLSKAFGLPSADVRAISIETGIQNAGLALVLIFAHFDGLGGMALVAGWWGIWHIISGFALARWLSRAQPRSSLEPLSPSPET